MASSARPRSRAGDESIVLFEQWLESGEVALLEGIRAYNEEDCRSTVELHEWLLLAAPAGHAVAPAPGRARGVGGAAEERDRSGQRFTNRCWRGGEEGSPRWLAPSYYHRRESKSQWWEWFHHLGLDEDELLEDTDTIGSLKFVEAVEDGQSLRHTFSFPPQEHKIDGRCVDPATQRTQRAGRRRASAPSRFRRSKNSPTSRSRRRSSPAADPGLAPPGLDRAVRPGLPGRGGERPLVEVLERQAPRARLDVPVPEAALSSAGATSSQGPPGSGKTWQGAKAAVALMKAGRRVGGDVAQPQGDREAARETRGAQAWLRFRGRKKSSGDDDSRSRATSSTVRPLAGAARPELQLVAGTRGSSSTPSSRASWTR